MLFAGISSAKTLSVLSAVMFAATMCAKFSASYSKAARDGVAPLLTPRWRKRSPRSVLFTPVTVISVYHALSALPFHLAHEAAAEGIVTLYLWLTAPTAKFVAATAPAALLKAPIFAGVISNAVLAA